LDKVGIVLAEEAVIEARVDAGHDMSDQLNGEVVNILDALRSNGYEPFRRIEDITQGAATHCSPGVPATSADLRRRMSAGRGPKPPAHISR
jgi:hypothetical protein